MKKNDEVTGVVTALGCNFEGIVKVDNTVCFIPFALLGEKITFKVLKVNKNVAYCKLLEVLTPADERVRPLCKVFSKCGGCLLQHIKYKEQLKFKTNVVKDCFKKIAGLEVNVKNTVKSDAEYNYRNKLQLPVRTTDKGNLIGFFAENSHRIVPITECSIQKEWNTQIIEIFNDFIHKYNVSCYNEETKTGELRHIVVRSVEKTLIIVAVVNGNTLTNYDKLISMLQQRFMKFSFFINENTGDSNVILGNNFTLLYGEEKVNVEEFGIKYSIGAQSFMQVNDGVKSKLYLDVIKLLDLDSETTVIDAYSGAGLMTAMFATRAKKSIGIEIVQEAVNSANELAKQNGLVGKMTNYCAPCEDVLPKIIETQRLITDKISVVLDPPRKGCDRKVLEAILKSKPDKIVYISCSPQTLARDVGILTGSLYYDGKELKKAQNFNSEYQITHAQPYDMFPQTKHVETLVCLSKKTEKHINIDVEFGEGEGQLSLKKLQEELNEQKPKKKTTYKDIQAYIEEKYGFKVHTAYIAEVKRDLGLPMYDAPNAVEELKRPRSHPTAEMVEAIKDALNHFEII